MPPGTTHFSEATLCLAIYPRCLADMITVCTMLFIILSCNTPNINFIRLLDMFAFLTPPRQAGRPHPALPQPKPHLSPDSSFPDRIY
jgi:hypothetical protein